MTRPTDNRQRQHQVRVNHRIRVPEVRVIAADGAQLGIMGSHEALRIARDAGLDLVEVNPKADPPVCKIMDFGRFNYEEKKKAREAKKNQKVVEIKEIKVRPKTDDHDLDTKIRQIREFLGEGNKTRITVRFRGREVTHPEKGREVIDEILKALEGLIVVEMQPAMEGKTMSCQIGPKPNAGTKKPLVPGAPGTAPGQGVAPTATS